MKIIKIIIIFLFTCVVAQADEIDDIIPFIIQVESGGNPNAVSSEGAIGLMQITPIVLEEYGLHNDSPTCKELTITITTFTPLDMKCKQCNVKVGEWYLRRLRDHYLKNVKIYGYGTRGKERIQPRKKTDYESIHCTVSWGEYKKGWENYFEIGYENWKGKDIAYCDYKPMITTRLELIDYSGFYIGEAWTGRKIDRFAKNVKLALILSAYNGGITRLRNNNYDINKMPRETRNYVKKVMKLYKEAQDGE